MSIVVEFSPQQTVKPGDLIRIALEVPRVGLLDLKGRWRVTRVEGTKVYADAVGQTDQPLVGQVAFVQAVADVRKDSVETHNKVQLLGEEPANSDAIPMLSSVPSPGQIPANAEGINKGILIDPKRFAGISRVTGKVVDVKGLEIRIQPDGPYVPMVGNRVLLISKNDSLVTIVGEGQISRVARDGVWATVGSSGISPYEGLLVEIEVQSVPPAVEKAQGSKPPPVTPQPPLERPATTAADYLDLGRGYAFPKSGEPDYAASVPYLRRAAEMGNIRGAFELCWVYLQDKSLLDQEEALGWLRRAAEKELPDAEFLLGLLYEGEFEVLEPNPQLAYEWLRRASSHGHATARKRLMQRAFHLPTDVK
jgi:hypothetical protein